MKISNYIKEQNIILNASVKGKNELLDLMIDAIAHDDAIKNHPSINFTTIDEAIYKREQQASTGLGDGFAFPHARLKGLDDIIVLIVTLKEGIDYVSFDGKPIGVACMILAPEDNPTLALKFMSNLVKILSHEKAQKVLKKATKSSELISLFDSDSDHIGRTILASDIMRSPYTSFSADTPLKKITHQMSVLRVNAVAITDDHGAVVGEITCDLLFNYGMPEFFQSLKSVSFIGEFDPFEGYFAQEAQSTAKDLMSTDFSSMPPTATLIEIVFALTVKNHPKVYVVDNNKLIGIIDQSTVLDRIVNF